MGPYHIGHIIWNLNLMKTLFESLIRELEKQQHDTILMNQYSTAWQSKNLFFNYFEPFYSILTFEITAAILKTQKVYMTQFSAIRSLANMQADFDSEDLNLSGETLR